MNPPCHIPPSRTWILGLALAGATMISSTSVVAVDYTLSDGGSTAIVDVNSSAGMKNWTVAGINQLNQQWFWYRTGSSGAQYSIDQLTFLGATKTGDNMLTSSYGNNNFSIQIKYTLHGGGVGSGSADIDEAISIHNLSGSALDFHFYQYSDFNLLNTAAGDTVLMDQGSAWQYKGLFQVAEGIILPDATRFEANVTGLTTSTLSKLGSTPGYNLSNTTTATGDVTWAYQWDVTLGANGTPEDLFTIVKDKALSITAVPEPTALSLLGLGLAGLAWRRRKCW